MAWKICCLHKSRLPFTGRACLSILLAGWLLNTSMAEAAIWQVDATSLNSNLTDFSVLFDDTGTPNQVDISDVVSWSGITITTPTVPPVVDDYDILTRIPDLQIGALTLLATNPSNPGFWLFEDTTGGSNTVTSSLFTYDAQIVPVPAAVWLFGSGLLGMIGIARAGKAT